MFENIPSEPKKLSVEDIFADTEVVPTTTPPPPSASSSFVPPPPIPPAAPQSLGSEISAMPTKPSLGDGKKWLMIVGAVVVVLIIGGAYWWWFLSSEPANNVNTEVNKEPVELEQPVVNTPIEVPSANPELEDIDNDRLNAREEAELGTDPANYDTDADGLFDGEEVKVYHTNPLNPDTDGDGYLDGMEVMNNYNPNGSGKLLELPSGEINFQELNNLINQIDQENS
ncbi:MAG: hypothetical protein V1712_02355 [Patescibacteria group bacterium]